VWNLLHVTLLASRILSWLSDVWRILCIPTLLLDIFFRNVQIMWKWDIIASTVKRPSAGQLRNNGSIPVRCKISLSSAKRLYRFSGLSPLCSLDMRDYFFPRSKGSVYEADKFHLSSAEVKKYSCFSTHHCLYCLLRDKFTLFLFVQDMMLEC